MYPRVSRQLRNLVAEMLQQADPIDDQLEERAKATKQSKNQTDELLARYKPSPISEAELPYIIIEGKLVQNKTVMT